tara:strand:- start:501 stop:767 length:267 start_codon:yes stop_codon:yes gene_type:complete
MTKLLKEIGSLRKFVHKLYKKLNNKKYFIVYKNEEGKTKTYLIGEIDLYKSFRNKEEDRDNAGFKAYCFARQQVRSFRHDRIVSITKK